MEKFQSIYKVIEPRRKLNKNKRKESLFFIILINYSLFEIEMNKRPPGTKILDNNEKVDILSDLLR